MRIEEVSSLISHPVTDSKISRWINEQCHGFNTIEVKCVDEDVQNQDMLQFLVQNFEPAFPCEQTIEDVSFTIEDALPFAQPLSVGNRPPPEETRHDHWNKAACYAYQDKKGTHNNIVAKKGCVGAVMRAHSLQEGIVRHSSKDLHASFENLCFPSK